MIKYNHLIQGSPEWHEHRLINFNGSDTAAMMGVSKYETRDELLYRLYLYGKDISSFTQKIFDGGHEYEKTALPWAEEIVGEELFSPTVSNVIDGLNLSSSFDGLSSSEAYSWEHKQLNESLLKQIEDNDLDLMYRIQMEQEFLIVSGTERCLFMASKGNKDEMVHCWYYPDKKLQSKIISGWKQFKVDLDNYVPPIAEVVAKHETINELPALSVQVKGEITSSNFDEYEEKLMIFVENINKDLKTDDDFATAENTIKFCKILEDKLVFTKEQSIAQMESVNRLFTRIGSSHSTVRDNRLFLEKLVKTQKEVRKQAIVMDGKNTLIDALKVIVDELGDVCLFAISNNDNFSIVIKNKRTISSIENAVNTEVARVKIEMNEAADTVRKNLKSFNENQDYKFLFNDLNTLIGNNSEYFNLVVNDRINSHKRKEEEKEAENIARIKADADKRITEETTRIESEKQQAIDAKEKADRDRLESDRKAKDTEENAVKMAEEAAQRERDKLASEQAAEQEAAKKRENNKKHKAKINNAIVKALVDFDSGEHKLTVDQAKLVVTAIASGVHPNVKIIY